MESLSQVSDGSDGKHLYGDDSTLPDSGFASNVSIYAFYTLDQQDIRETLSSIYLSCIHLRVYYNGVVGLCWGYELILAYKLALQKSNR